MIHCIMLAALLCVCLFVTSVFPFLLPLDLEENDVCEQHGQDLWFCRRLSQCSTAQNLFKNRKNPKICSFTVDEPIVCCQPPVISERLGNSISEQMCLEYAKAVHVSYSDPITDEIKHINTCALVEPTIVNGVDAQPREYPHMALIGYGNKPSIKWQAGGSLISERYVLSAAHCIIYYGNLANWVRLGDYNKNSDKDEYKKEARSVEYEIAERIKHPEYNDTNKHNDIVLFKLKQRVKFDEYIRPICLQREHTFPKTYAIATGWGRTERSGPESDILQKVNLTIIERKKCLDKYRRRDRTLTKISIVDKSMLCAGDEENDKDTCQVDSGGPLQIRLQHPYCMYSLVGITSKGVGCASGYPSIYTRVSHFVPWIESIVWP